MLMLATGLMLTTVTVVMSAVEPDERAVDPMREKARRALIAAAFPGGAPFDVDAEFGDREIFEQVLDTDLFVHEEIGQIDLYVMVGDELDDSLKAGKAMRAMATGLKPLASLLERFEPGDRKLIGGRRFPIVVTKSNWRQQQKGFDQLVALLDWCDWTGWRGPNEIWNNDNRRELTVRTWDAQLFNLADVKAYNKESKDPHAPFFEHGLGYYSIGHFTALLLRLGVKADIMPHWFQQGLIDELDIAAYGEAWVGGDWWEKRTAGWYNPGWSGFLPTGASPPPKPAAPPLDGRVTVTKTGDSWQHRSNSPTRHWESLVADRKEDDPVNFVMMSGHETLYPRDRAYARYVVHILLELAPPDDGTDFLRMLDREPYTPEIAGMPDSDPLPVVISRFLGGVPEIDELYELSAEEVFEEAGKTDIIKRTKTDLNAAEMLRFSDHRAMADWLASKNAEEIEWEQRLELWNFIMSAEWYRQEMAWRHVHAVLDRGAESVLQKVKRYPTREKDLEKVRDLFWSGVETD